MHKTLKEFGLSENEIKVYLVSLNATGDLTPYKISKTTKIPRTTVYDVLMELSLKGLIKLDQSDGFTKQQTLVTAKNPTILRDILQKRRKELIYLEADVINILPALKKDYHKQNKTSSDFQFFPGIEGVKRILFDYQHTKLELPLYRWDKLLPSDTFSRAELEEHIKKTLMIEKERIDDTKVLIPLNDWTKHVLTYQYKKDISYIKSRNLRFIDNPIYNVYARLEIIGKYLTVVCTEKEETWGLKIKSQALASTFRTFFQIQWEQAIPITEKFVKSLGRNQFK